MLVCIATILLVARFFVYAVRGHQICLQAFAALKGLNEKANDRQTRQIATLEMTERYETRLKKSHQRMLVTQELIVDDFLDHFVT